jgi:D-amino-acid oxidase
MQWLTKLVEQKGAGLITGTITGDLFNQETSLRAKYNVDVIFNAAGLAEAELAGDTACCPIRGSLPGVINDGSDFPKLNHALTIGANAVHDSNEILFVVPRNDKILLIDGITEPNKHELSLTVDSPIIKRMRARYEAFLPGLKNARLDHDYPLAQGLRPFRQLNVLVERELMIRKPSTAGTVAAAPSCIVHFYGPRQIRMTLSFGCAGDVAALVAEMPRLVNYKSSSTFYQDEQ